MSDFLDFISGTGADTFTSYDPSVDAAIGAADPTGLGDPFSTGSVVSSLGLNQLGSAVQATNPASIGGYFNSLAQSSNQLFGGLTSILGGVSSALGGANNQSGTTGLTTQLQNLLRGLGLQQPTATTPSTFTSNSTLLLLVGGAVILFFLFKDKK